MRKQSSQSFLVVGDTNTVFSRDPKQVVAEGFAAAWLECSKLGVMRLLLPEIVRGERTYQMLRAAKQSRDGAERNMQVLADISDSTALRLPEIPEIREAIEKRFDDWARSMNAEIVPVPCGKIDWRRVVNDAIWRVAPFVAPGDNKDTEKGFRDCLIMETLDELIRTSKGGQVVFLTRDRELREAAIARFQPEAFAAYEDLHSFRSYLELTHEHAEKAENDLIQQIMQKAPSIFYSADNPDCIYAKFDVRRRILEKFAPQLDILSSAESQDEVNTSGRLIPFTNEKILIDSTEHTGCPSKGAWAWKTSLRFVRLFRTESPETADRPDSPLGALVNIFSTILSVNETVRIAPFEVNWSAHCDGQGRFSRLKLVSLKPLPQSREDGFFKNNYGFKPIGPPE